MIRKNSYPQSLRAFSMVEVIVASILFAAASVGVFATISYTNRTAESTAKVKTAMFSKKILDQLNKDVSEATWATGSLTLGVHNVAAGSDPDFPACSATYTVSDASGARKVVVDATCP